jgi:hypothetical protein
MHNATNLVRKLNKDYGRGTFRTRIDTSGGNEPRRVIERKKDGIWYFEEWAFDWERMADRYNTYLD